MNDVYKALLEELSAGQRAVVVSTYSSGDKAILSKKLYTSKEPADSGDILGRLAYEAAQKGELQFLRQSDDSLLIAEPYYPRSRLIILGGGHIAKPLHEFGAKTGFSVTVVDDRPFFANRQRFPLAENVICESFDKCFELLNLNSSAFVVIITRGHRHDIDCLRQVFNYNTAYMGMIGSKRRVHAARKQLAEEGFDKERLEALCAPIGLDIGAETPEEIAVSIISQVIKYKRKVSGSSWPEPDMEVLEELGSLSETPRAVVTIIATKGSVPRDTGAKMIVFSDGRTLGSIGGGCAEGSVILTARDVINEGGFKTEHIDMTGEVAEDEGMVCGGTMDVIIESYS